MDIIDRAQKRIDIQLEEALQHREPELTAKGQCYNCNEPLPHNKKFCDADCRDDWEKRHKWTVKN